MEVAPSKHAQTMNHQGDMSDFLFDFKPAGMSSTSEESEDSATVSIDPLEVAPLKLHSNNNDDLPSKALVAVLECCALLAARDENPKKYVREFDEAVSWWYDRKDKRLDWHDSNALELPGPNPGWWILLGYVRPPKWLKVAKKLVRASRKLTEEDLYLFFNVIERVYGYSYYGVQCMSIPKTYFDHPVFHEAVTKLIEMGTMRYRRKDQDMESYVEETIRTMTLGLSPEGMKKMNSLRRKGILDEQVVHSLDDMMRKTIPSS